MKLVITAPTFRNFHRCNWDSPSWFLLSFPLALVEAACVFIPFLNCLRSTRKWPALLHGSRPFYYCFYLQYPSLRNLVSSYSTAGSQWKLENAQNLSKWCSLAKLWTSTHTTKSRKHTPPILKCGEFSREAKSWMRSWKCTRRHWLKCTALARKGYVYRRLIPERFTWFLWCTSRTLARSWRDTKAYSEQRPQPRLSTKTMYYKPLVSMPWRFHLYVFFYDPVHLSCERMLINKMRAPLLQH